MSRYGVLRRDTPVIYDNGENEMLKREELVLILNTLYCGYDCLIIRKDRKESYMIRLDDKDLEPISEKDMASKLLQKILKKK